MCLHGAVLRWSPTGKAKKTAGWRAAAAAANSGSRQGNVTTRINFEMNNLCSECHYHGWAERRGRWWSTVLLTPQVPARLLPSVRFQRGAKQVGSSGGGGYCWTLGRRANLCQDTGRRDRCSPYFPCPRRKFCGNFMQRPHSSKNSFLSIFQLPHPLDCGTFTIVRTS